MRTLYSRRPNRTRAIAAASIFLVVVLIFGSIRLFAPNFFFALTAPLLQSGSFLTAAVGNSTNSFSDASKLAAQNQALAEQILVLKNQNQVLTARTQDLTKLLGAPAIPQPVVTVGVLARPPQSPYDTLLLGAGSTDGIAVGQEVFAQGGTPIGTIAQVSANSSKVDLFSSSGRNTAGWVGENRIPLTLIGVGGGAFKASLPKGSSVAAGELVYVPGPGAIPMGTILRIETDPSSPSEILRIQPSVNLFSITWVQVGASSL